MKNVKYLQVVGVPVRCNDTTNARRPAQMPTQYARCCLRPDSPAATLISALFFMQPNVTGPCSVLFSPSPILEPRTWINSERMTENSAKSTRREQCPVFHRHRHNRNDNHPAFSDTISAEL
jgi:hypothetical protein